MIAGDSFGMPRPFKMNNEIEMQYEDCYPDQLRRLLTNEFKNDDTAVINYCKRANTTLGILRDLENPRYGEIYLCQPHYLVIQVGNTDCFERDKHHDEFAPFVEFRGKNPWINQQEFFYLMGEIIKRALTAVPVLKGIIVVNIPPIGKQETKKFKLTRQRISAYNHQLKVLHGLQNLIFVVDIYGIFMKSKTDPLSSDGIHPNRLGSELTARGILESIRLIHSQTNR